MSESEEVKSENRYLDFQQRPVKPVLVRKKDIYRCISCGIQDARVEAGGIWHCPNPLCTVSGASNARRTFGFHATEDSDGATPTPEFIALRGWAERMFKTKK